MAKSRKIMLAGKSLYQHDIETIVAFASRPGHQRYDLGIDGDYYRNLHVVQSFLHARGRDSDCDHATTAELVDAFHEATNVDWSKEFNALRLGENLGWGIEHGIVRYEQGWRLIHREIQFELVGPASRQRAIRIRNAPPEQVEENALLWARELKRRERARLKRLGQHKSSIENWMPGILRTAADTPLEGPLACFALGSFQTIGAVHKMIVAAVDGMTLKEAAEIDCYLGGIWAGRPADDFKRPHRVTSADDAVLEGLYL